MTQDDRSSTVTSDRSARSILTPGLAIGLIFVGSFVLSVLFTAAILAGKIEIQPSAIKAFVRSILGKN
jgi:hypothetical protein